jgi:tight adherence protein B
MEGIAFVIRERMRLSRRFRVLSAQTQASKRILLALPVVMFFLMNLINAEYMRVFYDTTAGTILLASAGCSMVLGWLLMNRMSIVRH